MSMQILSGYEITMYYVHSWNDSRALTHCALFLNFSFWERGGSFNVDFWSFDVNGPKIGKSVKHKHAHAFLWCHTYSTYSYGYFWDEHGWTEGISAGGSSSLFSEARIRCVSQALGMSIDFMHWCVRISTHTQVIPCHGFEPLSSIWTAFDTCVIILEFFTSQLLIFVNVKPASQCGHFNGLESSIFERFDNKQSLFLETHILAPTLQKILQFTKLFLLNSGT